MYRVYGVWDGDHENKLYWLKGTRKGRTYRTSVIEWDTNRSNATVFDNVSDALAWVAMLVKGNELAMQVSYAVELDRRPDTSGNKGE